MSTHFDEVLRLINRSPRVATLWHRIGGPALVRQVIAWRGPESPLFPPNPAPSFAKYLGRLLAELARFGSVQLQRDVARYGSLVAAMPGVTVEQLENWRLG